MVDAYKKGYSTLTLKSGEILANTNNNKKVENHTKKLFPTKDLLVNYMVK